MKALLASIMLALAVSGCTAPDGPSSAPSTAPSSIASATPTVTATPTPTPTPSPPPSVLDVPLAKGRSTAKVLVSDRDQHTDEWVQKEYGPDGFTVSGSLIVLPNDVRGDITIYRDGKPVLRKKVPGGYVYDVLVHDGLLYLLGANTQTTTTPNSGSTRSPTVAGGFG